MCGEHIFLCVINSLSTNLFIISIGENTMYSYPNSNTEKKIALMIINDFFIQKAHELWIFLQLDQCFNDYEATLIWVKDYLEEHPEGEYSDIQKAFVSCFPEHFFSFDC